MADGDTFTTKEMLVQILADVREVKATLNTKADVTSVADVRARLTAVEREIDTRAASIKRIDEKADKVYVNGVKEEVDELKGKVSSLTKALYTASLSVVGAVLVFLVQQGGFH